MLERYWSAVSKLPPLLGALYVSSKIIIGLGFGMLVAASTEQAAFAGFVLTISGFILMVPAELHIIPASWKKRRK